MRAASERWPRMVAVAVVAALAACSDSQSTAPVSGWTPEFARDGGRRTGVRIVNVADGAKAEVIEAVMRLRGRIDRSYKGIDAIAVRGLDEVATAELSRRPDVRGIGDDVALAWIPAKAEAIGQT